MQKKANAPKIPVEAISDIKYVGGTDEGDANTGGYKPEYSTNIQPTKKNLDNIIDIGMISNRKFVAHPPDWVAARSLVSQWTICMHSGCNASKRDAVARSLRVWHDAKCGGPHNDLLRDIRLVDAEIQLVNKEKKKFCSSFGLVAHDKAEQAVVEQACLDYNDIVEQLVVRLNQLRIDTHRLWQNCHDIFATVFTMYQAFGEHDLIADSGFTLDDAVRVVNKISALETSFLRGVLQRQRQSDADGSSSKSTKSKQTFVAPPPPAVYSSPTVKTAKPKKSQPVGEIEISDLPTDRRKDETVENIQKPVSSNSHGGRQSRSATFETIIVGSSVGAAVAILLIITGIVVWHRRRKHREEFEHEQICSAKNNRFTHKFEYV